MLISTIGHSSRSIEEFIAVLKAHSIEQSIDIGTVRPDSINTAWRNASFRGYAGYMQTAEFADALLARGIAVEHVQSATRAHPHRITPFAQVNGWNIKYAGEPI